MKIAANPLNHCQSLRFAGTAAAHPRRGAAWWLGALTALSLLPAARAQTTIGYNFGTTTPVATSTSGTQTNFTAGSLTIANSFGTVATPISTTSPSSGYTGASGGENIGQSVNNNAFSTSSSPYFTLTLTPASGYQLSITNFSFGERGTSTAATLFSLRSSVDGYAASLGSGSLATTSSWNLISPAAFSLTGTTSAAITLRLYVYGGASNAGSGTINTRVDDVSITLTSTLIGSAPKNLTYAPANAGGSTNFNTTASNTNFTDTATSNSSAFSTGDNVSFTDTGVGTVAVDAGGVAPGSMAVSNTTGTYTFTGGAIGGSGALTKTGAGTLDLTGQTAGNGYSGGTNLNGGVTIISNDNQLGATAGTIAMAGGTLRTAASVTSARAIAFNTGGGTIDTNGFDSSFSGAFSGTGDFTKAGAGALTVSGTLNYTGNTAVSGGSLILAQTGTTNLTAAAGGGTFAGNLILANASRLNLNGGTFSGGGLVQVQATGASIANTGTGVTVTIGNNVVLNSLNVATPFSVNLGPVSSATMTVNGVISGTSDLNLAGGGLTGGSGTLNLNGQNTYTGATTVNFSSNTARAVLNSPTGNALGGTTSLTINVGTVTLGSSNQIVDSASVALKGGAINTAGFSETVGALTLGASSSLSFGTGSTTSVVRFADSSAIAWTGVLTISNYTGAVRNMDGSIDMTPGGDALIFGNSGTALTAGQVQEIQFLNPSGSLGTYPAYIDADGDILAVVPEPATVLGGVLLIGAAGWSQRRRLCSALSAA